MDRENAVLTIFECRRWHPGGWSGCLIIAASDEAEARSVFANFEQRPPVSVITWEDVFALGEPRLLSELLP